MNPEFRRQLWLQFSPTRLVLMPALLLLGAVAILLSSDRSDTASMLSVSAGVAFMVLVFGMGSRAASASVMDEVTERTWDQQLTARGLTPEEVEAVIRDKSLPIEASRSSGRPCKQGWTPTGRYIFVTWDVLEEDPLVIYPVTAYEPDGG